MLYVSSTQYADILKGKKYVCVAGHCNTLVELPSCAA